MTAKQYLRQARRLDNMVDAKLEQVMELRNLYKTTSTTP